MGRQELLGKARKLCWQVAHRIGLDLGARFDSAPSTSSVKVVRHTRARSFVQKLWKTRDEFCEVDWDWHADFDLRFPGQFFFSERKVKECSSDFSSPRRAVG